jgi:hypothetical protein
MSKAQTVDVPLQVIERLQGVLAELEQALSPYRPDFLARMYRARASDLEGKGKSLFEVNRHFQKAH